MYIYLHTHTHTHTYIYFENVRREETKILEILVETNFRSFFFYFTIQNVAFDYALGH